MAGYNTFINLCKSTAEKFTSLGKALPFIYARASAMNEELLKDYPCILIDSTPVTEWAKPNKSYLPSSKTYRIKIFLYDTYKIEQQRTKSLYEKQEDTEILLEQYIAELYRLTLNNPSTYPFAINIEGARGFLANDVHNDRLVQAYAEISVTVQSHCNLGTFL